MVGWCPRIPYWLAVTGKTPKSPIENTFRKQKQTSIVTLGSFCSLRQYFGTTMSTRNSQTIIICPNCNSNLIQSKKITDWCCVADRTRSPQSFSNKNLHQSDVISFAVFNLLLSDFVTDQYHSIYNYKYRILYNSYSNT